MMNAKSSARNVVSRAKLDVYPMHDTKRSTDEGQIIQTVLGQIQPDKLGATMTHEHLLIDISTMYTLQNTATGREFFEKPVSLDTLGRIRHYLFPNADNARLTNVDTAIKEAMLFKRHGGNTLVDATSIGIGRDPVGLAQISLATGINVIMGSSYYVSESHPKELHDKSVSDIAEGIAVDIVSGADGTSIRAGIIGEVGCSWPLNAAEIKVLKASARAQMLTGAPLLIHPGRDEAAPMEIINILKEAGANLNRTIMSHIDRTVFEKDTLHQIADSGCFLEWDLFGREKSVYIGNPDIDMPSDAKRIDDIAWTASQGYGNQILLSMDICTKERLETYGGHGYYYILAHIVPRMKARGVGDESIHDFLVENPKAALSFVPQGHAGQKI